MEVLRQHMGQRLADQRLHRVGQWIPVCFRHPHDAPVFERFAFLTYAIVPIGLDLIEGRGPELQIDGGA